MEVRSLSARPIIARFVSAILLGATLALSLAFAPRAWAVDSVAHSEDGWIALHRLWGDTALDTMQEVCRQAFPGTSDNAVLVTSGGYWDALSASSLAGALDAPVIMTDADRLSSQALAELRRLQVKRIYICGGTAAVSSTVESHIVAAIPGVSIVRASGADAVKTSIDCAEKTRDIQKQEHAAPSDLCIIATVEGYWDALSASPLSYATGAPIFLSKQSGLSSETLAAIGKGGYRKALVCGGASALSSGIEGQLAQAGVTDVTREAGDDAYVTSARVAGFSMRNHNMRLDGMGVATAHGYWDGVTGAALCGSRDSVLVLADEGFTDALDATFFSHRDIIESAYVFGGSSAVADSVWNLMKQDHHY